MNLIHGSAAKPVVIQRAITELRTEIAEMNLCQWFFTETDKWNEMPDGIKQIKEHIERRQINNEVSNARDSYSVELLPL